MRADAVVSSMQVYDLGRATGETRCPLIHQAATLLLWFRAIDHIQVAAACAA